MLHLRKTSLISIVFKACHRLCHLNLQGYFDGLWMEGPRNASERVEPRLHRDHGMGQLFPCKGGHWSFPFEIGVAFIGSPKINMALTSGQVCDSTGLNCVNVATDQQLQTNLQAQMAKYHKDVDPLKTFPILGGGIVYNFSIRSH